MAFTDSWAEDYPVGTTPANELDTAIAQGVKRALRERLALDHIFESAETSDDIGRHKNVTLPVLASDASSHATGVVIYTKNVDDVPELFARFADGSIKQLTSGGVWRSLELIASVAQGDVFYYDGTAMVRLAAGTAGMFLKTLGAAANPLWARPQRALVWVEAYPAVGTNKGLTFRMPFAATIVYARAQIVTAPVGATMIIDINVGGTTIFTSTKLVIADGETSGSQNGLATTALAAGDIVTMDVDQIGSTTAGANLTVQLELDI
jgi:hypothetical protein